MTDPMELDCQAAADRLHELIDQELTPEVEAAVQHHLEACAPCMAVYEFEQGFQRFMTLKMQGVGIPRNLRARIAQRLSQETSQAGDR